MASVRQLEPTQLHHYLLHTENPAERAGCVSASSSTSDSRSVRSSRTGRNLPLSGSAFGARLECSSTESDLGERSDEVLDRVSRG
jgi:hypothetical protein